MSAIIGLSTFMDNLAAVSISGISKNYAREAPIGGIPSANLPASWVRVTETLSEPWVMESGPGFGRLSAEVVIAVKPVSQYPLSDDSDLVTLMDNARTALSTAVVGSSLSTVRISKPEVWTFEDNLTYLVFVVRVEASG